MIRVVIDTDIQDDVDDVGALAVAHGLVTAGEAELIGIAVNTTSRWGAGAAAAVNTWYGRPEIPIGVRRPLDDGVSTDPARSYADVLAQQFPHPVGDGSDLPDAVALYRRLLAGAGEHSVTIVSIGFLTNLADLLSSRPDAFSDLSGTDLVAAKVDRLVVMGGTFPSGREFNFVGDVAATRAVIDGWPTPQVYLGFEAADTVMSGAGLTATAPETSPVRKAYEIHSGPGNPRNSWDPATVLYAVRGGGDLYRESEPGQLSVADDGSNIFTPHPDGRCRHLFRTASDESVAAALDALLLADR